MKGVKSMDNKEVLKRDTKALAMELKAEVVKLENALAQFETDIGLLQGAKKDELYWDGEGAYKFLKASNSHFEHDSVLVNNLNKCSDYLESIAK